MSTNFTNFILSKMGVDKNTKSSALIRSIKELVKPRTPVFPLNHKQMIDIVYLPEDDEGYKYCLVIMDLSRYVQLFPLKTITSASVLKGIKHIYENSKLKPPFIVQFDNGPEFKNDVKKYFEKVSNINYAKPYRSRQMGLIEYFNNLLGKYIGYYQNMNELKTNKPNFDWVHLIDGLADTYNETQKGKLKQYEENVKKNRYPKCKGDDCNLLNVGDKVLIPLEKPIQSWNRKVVKGKKNFRSNDLRFSPKEYEIKNIILKPGNQPPMYQLKGDKHRTAYTKAQFIEVDKLKDDLKI
ncbi:MAG: transposase family protein [Arcobacter sp.]|nr:transposase family protein [Arcobacter sp.]